MNQNDQNSNKDYYLIIFIVIAIIFTAITFFFPYIILYLNPHLDGKLDERGQFGDSYGALNSLFSGIALVGVIVSILMQRKELKLTRDEMISARYEYKLNRITNLIYLQLEKHEKFIKEFSYNQIHQKPIHGIHGIAKLELKLIPFNNAKNLGIIDVTPIKKELLHNLNNISFNNSHLSSFILSVDNNFKAMETLIVSGGLENSDIITLMTVINQNIGYVNKSVFYKIYDTTYLIGKYKNDLSFTLQEVSQYNSCYDINIHIEDIVNFLDKRY